MVVLINCLRLGETWVGVKNSWGTHLGGTPIFSWALLPGTHQDFTVKIREKFPPVSCRRWGKAIILKYNLCSPQQKPTSQGKLLTRACSDLGQGLFAKMRPL